MSLQPFTQPTSDEYQTCPIIRVRSAWSAGCGSPMARMMMPSMTRPICCWHSMAAGSGEAREANTAATRLGLAPHGPQGPLEHVEDPLRCRRPPRRDLRQAGVELLHPEHEGRRQQVVLGREVPVDGAHGHVGPGGHVTHLDRLVAPLEAELHGGVDHPLATSFLSPGQRTRASTRCCTPSRYSGPPAWNGTRSTPRAALARARRI